MGKNHSEDRKSRSRSSSKKRSLEEDTTTSSSSDVSDSSSSLERRREKRRRHRRSSSSHRHHHSNRSRRHRKEDDDDDGDRKKRKEKRRRHSRRSKVDSDSGSDHDDDSSSPEVLARTLLETFPGVAPDLHQLLQTIDNGQGVDMMGIPNKSLVKHLKKLLFSLKLKQNENGVFLLPVLGVHTLEVIGPILCSYLRPTDDQLHSSGSPTRRQASPSNVECLKNDAGIDAARLAEVDAKHDSSAPIKRRVMGPEMPSRELLAAAAELTEAETLMREADLEVDNDLLIGPPPPAMVAEAESANEAERFEEVSRITAVETERPYDVLGVNWKMTSDNIKKRYWKLSLMVHPDKCSHPQAHEAFVKLNQAFKDLQDPTKRNAMDEKIKMKEEQEAFKAELRQLREAAQWRKLQGISIEGDEELLEIVKEVPKRDEWMTTLPPERKPGGMPMQSTSFSKNAKEGRGDTSIWTDSPLDKAEKAKQNYLEAVNKTKVIADTEDTKLRTSSDAYLVDKYNSAKRSMSLVQKHQEESTRHLKKKSSKPDKGERRLKTKSIQKEKEEWVGQHPWKPFDREKDLAGGRKQVNLDSEGMAQGLSSRFSSGAVQRNFL